MAKSFGFTKTLRRVRRLLKPGAVILCYHRICEAESDPFQLAVSPKNFRAQMAYLKKHYLPMSLPDLIEALELGSLPERAVAVTFDDGYRDNLLNALPVLREFQIPATVGLISGQIEHPSEFWWDKLERVFFDKEDLPETLSLDWRGSKRRFHCTDKKKRLKTYQTLHSYLLPLAEEERKKIIESLVKWAGVKTENLDRKPFLTREDAARLAEDPLITVGIHSKTHPFLSSPDNKELEQEIVESRIKIREITGKNAEVFVYPFGDYDKNVLGVLKREGYRTALTTKQGSVDKNDDRFQLRRCKVLDWDRETFQKRMKHFFRN